MTPGPVNLERLVAQLRKHEGFEQKPYRCTASKLTIGVGYNIDAHGLGLLSAAIGRTVTLADLYRDGITEREGDLILRRQIEDVEAAVRAKFPIYEQLDDIRRRVVLDFVFNVGGTGALAFKTTIARLRLALEQTDPQIEQVCLEACAFHLMNSLWADQIDDGLRGRYGRADRLCEMLRTGKEPTR